MSETPSLETRHCKKCGKPFDVDPSAHGRPRVMCDKHLRKSPRKPPTPEQKEANDDRMYAMRALRKSARASGEGDAVRELLPSDLEPQAIQTQIKETMVLLLHDLRDKMRHLAPRDIPTALRALAQVQESMFGQNPARHAYTSFVVQIVPPTTGAAQVVDVPPTNP